MVENRRILPFFNAIPTGLGNNLDSLFFYHNVIPTGFYDVKKRKCSTLETADKGLDKNKI